MVISFLVGVTCNHFSLSVTRIQTILCPLQWMFVHELCVWQLCAVRAGAWEHTAAEDGSEHLPQVQEVPGRPRVCHPAQWPDTHQGDLPGLWQPVSDLTMDVGLGLALDVSVVKS